MLLLKELNGDLKAYKIYVYFQEKEAKDPLSISQWEAGLPVPAS